LDEERLNRTADRYGVELRFRDYRKMLARALVSRGYSGFAVCEYEKWWHPELPDPMEALPKELSYVKSLFGGARP